MKSFRFVPALLALLLTLSGCAIPSGDELLAAPKPSKSYQTLQDELSKILSTQSYAAPLGGENRSTVQLVDLDGDGAEEAVSFFKKNGNSNEYTIYIYKKQNDAYVCTGSIQGAGSGIDSVYYPVITPKGQRGILIGWRQQTSDSLGSVTMCAIGQDCAPTPLLEAECSAMELTDLTGDGAKDLLLLTADLTGKRVARLYRYNGSELLSVGEAPTSQDAVTIERIFPGYAADHTPAVFTEEKTASGIGLTTDIFVYANGTLHNLALDGEDSAARGTYRPLSVSAADINKDGITELPRAVLMAGYTDAAATDALFMLDWYSYAVDGAPKLVQTTYHNVSEEWFFTIDSTWHDQITATKSSENGLSAVHFFQYLPDGKRTPIFSIYCATGPQRSYYATRTDLVQLAETGKGVFFARLDEGAAASPFQLDADKIRSHFSLVMKSWSN